MSSQSERTKDQDAESLRKLTVYANSGLCNRLKVLLSGMAIAQASGRRFAMRWPKYAITIPFDRLFQNEWNVGADVPFDRRRMIDLTTRPWRTLPDLTQAQDDWLMVGHYDWLIRPARYPSHSALLAQCASSMQTLKPLPPLQERVDAFRASYFRPQMIGVHLRRGDFFLIRPDVVNNLAPTIETVDRWLEQSPHAGILLCTDDGAEDPFTHRKIPYEGVAERFVQRYGARVVMPRPHTLDRRQPESTEDALVELWLLRSTDWFVGTEGSSFSEIAVFGRTVPSLLTAAPTREYQSQVRRLKRTGLYGAFSRVSRYEYGRVVPCWLLMFRFGERFRSFIRRIAPPRQASGRLDGTKGE